MNHLTLFFKLDCCYLDSPSVLLFQQQIVKMTVHGNVQFCFGGD